MSFDLSNYDTVTALITLEWAADNFYGGYRLNSSSFTGALPDDGQWTTYKTLTLAGPAATFVSGRTLLEFRVPGDGETDGFILRSMQGTAARR